MKSLVDKFKVAFRGLFILLKDKAVIIQTIISILVIIAFKLLNISDHNLIIIIIMCGLVVLAEMINTVIEKIMNFIEPNFNPTVGLIKDLSAGFVLFISIIAAIVGLLILGELLC